MSVPENLPAAPPRNGGRTSGALYAHRKRRNDFANLCYAEMEGIVTFWRETYQDKSLSIEQRLEAAEKIVKRAVGEVAKAAVELGESQDSLGGNSHVTFQWLPADPSDHSKVIEPE
jgi:hypothetical protein